MDKLRAAETTETTEQLWKDVTQERPVHETKELEEANRLLESQAKAQRLEVAKW